MEKKQVYFIINGTETTVEVESSDIALNCAMTALMQVGANGRSIEEYQIISNDQTLYWDKPLLDQVKPDGVVFLSLKDGVGGNIQPSKQPPSEASEQKGDWRLREPDEKVKEADNPRDFLIMNYGWIEQAVDNGMDIRLDEIEILSVMSAYAKSERSRAIDECITLLEEINREEIDVDTYLLSQLEKLKSRQ